MTSSRSLTAFVFFLFVLSPIPGLRAQEIVTPEGYSPQVGTLVSMLDDLKARITRQVEGLDQEQTDFLLDGEANRIGAMILHLAATEKIYQLLTFENRTFNEEEEAEWGAAMSLGDAGRAELVGQPIRYYLDRWSAIREETKRLLREKDDDWLAEVHPEYGMNMHWSWFHVMEHQANHMGQIALIRKRM